MMKIPVVVRRSILSYLLVLALPLITGFIVYQVSINIAEKKSIQTNQIVLNQTKDILERRLLEIDRFTRLLATNENLNRVLNPTVHGNDRSKVFDLRKLSLDLSTLSQSNNIFNDIYIYLDKEDLIISPGSIYYRTHHFYDAKHYTNMSSDQWIQRLKTNKQVILPLQTIETTSNKFDGITAIYPIPYNAVQEVRGSAVVIIDEKQILELLSRITEEGNGWAYITDENNQLIAKSGIDMDTIKQMNQLILSKHGETNFYDDDHLVISTVTKDNRWSLVVGIPKVKVLAEANRIKEITILVTMITIIIGLSTCLLLSYRNFKPIQRLINQMKLDMSQLVNPHENEFTFIEKNISQLVTKNESLKREMELQKPLLQSAIMNRILRGEISTESEIMASLKHANFYLPGNNQTGIVTILSIDPCEMMINERENMDEALHILVKKYVRDHHLPFVVTDWSRNKLVLIHFSKTENGMNHCFEEMLLELHQFMKTNYNMTTIFGIGTNFANINEISQSFRAAQDALHYSQLISNQSTIIYYHDIKKEKSFYYYPIDVEIRVMNALKKGQHEEVCQLVNEVLNQNILNKQLSPEMVVALIQEMKATFVRELQSSIFSSPNLSKELITLNNLQLEDGLETLKQQFFHLSEEHSRFLKMIQQDMNHALVEKIKKNNRGSLR